MWRYSVSLVCISCDERAVGLDISSSTVRETLSEDLVERLIVDILETTESLRCTCQRTFYFVPLLIPILQHMIV